ncbi:MAG: GNAT family N-acetyltransferase [Ruegeria sp.]
MTPEEMATLHAAAFHQSRPWIAVEFKNILANPFSYIVGNKECFAVYQVVSDEAELLTIATHPDLQGRGLGKNLMTVWQTQAHRLGATRAFLEVASDNRAAIALYDCCGYAPCGLRRGYYRRKSGGNMDAIVMERSLP